MIATAPAEIALSMSLFPSLDSPRIATKASPGFTRRESYSIPLMLALPLWERISDRKSTRLNSSHEWISYAVFCLKKKKNEHRQSQHDKDNTFGALWSV